MHRKKIQRYIIDRISVPLTFQLQRDTAIEIETLLLAAEPVAPAGLGGLWGGVSGSSRVVGLELCRTHNGLSENNVTTKKNLA